MAQTRIDPGLAARLLLDELPLSRHTADLEWVRALPDSEAKREVLAANESYLADRAARGVPESGQSLESQGYTRHPDSTPLA